MKRKIVAMLVAAVLFSACGIQEPAPPLYEKPTVQAPDGALLLVNAQYPLPEDYQPELVGIGDKFQMESRAAAALIQMREDAKTQGIDLLVCSAYRPREKQQTNFDKKVKSYVAAGLGMDESVAATKLLIAEPGTSEHESGLAVDIVTPNYQMLNRGYAQTAAAKWLAENAPSYGFILRYPDGKTELTGIDFEPWHYRYVGDAAEEITRSGLCLEEYLG